MSIIPDPQPAESKPESPGSAARESGLERGTYEIIQNRLKNHAEELHTRIEKLNHERREVFGSIETELVSTQRITTVNNCLPRDIVPVGERFIFGYNVHMGLKAVTELSDVFSVYHFANGAFHEDSLDLFDDKTFRTDFEALCKYYKDTTFTKFFVAGPHFYLVFQIGKSPTDIKTFKFLIEAGEAASRSRTSTTAAITKSNLKKSR